MAQRQATGAQATGACDSTILSSHAGFEGRAALSLPSTAIDQPLLLLHSAVQR